IADRDMDPDPVVLPARLEQQHRDARIGGEPVREQAPRGAGADDDVVESARVPHHPPRFDVMTGRKRESVPDTGGRHKTTNGTTYDRGRAWQRLSANDDRISALRQETVYFVTSPIFRTRQSTSSRKASASRRALQSIAARMPGLITSRGVHMKSRLITACIAAVALSAPAVAFSADTGGMSKSPDPGTPSSTMPSNPSSPMSSAPKGGDHGVVSDAAITTKIKAELAKEKDVNMSKIQVDTDKGVVTLKGT